ncbi:hypothetical protein ACOTJF_18155 [Achromobacter ruhlandii]|uniref:hypothetical protein n=1 Tax=Achromobacter ruhlandii TaxID=72557 RepID=UPI003BA3A3AD
MTNQNSAAPTDAEILSLYGENMAAHSDGRGYDAGVISFARALLSKLRAPVADERQAVDPCGYVAVKSSAVDWLKDKFPALTIKAGLCERIGGRLYTITRLMRDHDAALASAPVAGQAYQGDNVAERLDSMADGLPPGSQAQSDLYAAATIWRKHISHHAAPQASAEDDREALAHKVNLLTAESLGHRSAAGHLSALVDELRRHLIEARQAMTDLQQAFVPAFDTPETLTMVPNDALVPFCAVLDRLCELDLPQADKDGGQQRSGGKCEHARAYRAQSRGGYACPDCGEFVSDYEIHRRQRAALSATQPEQGERDE